ncbi:MAG: multiheme c-type cytochrome [Sulfurospirillaceae bacterium]|nr:multiheme c-type cytochrome [Sulfurospirillaceae bacterium]MDD3462328.1 multiheme c-type cytochrome [Sulfurospirillaceae bacterium]
MKLGKLVVAVLMAIGLASGAYATTQASSKVNDAAVKNANDKCLNCHMKENKGIVSHWQNSSHKDANVGCFTCHAADKGDVTAYEHEGVVIKTIQTPNDCKFCHEREVKEMTNSHHATAGEIMASLDNMLADVIASFPDTKADAVNGCWQCHGSILKFELDKNGKKIFNEAGAPKMDYMTYPNSGIGRIGFDGTKGSCNACHSRHDFSSSRARQPENCGKCHLGPDHPQKEIYEESKHGIAYFSAPKGKVAGGMNIEKKGTWVLGKDYSAAPTCSTCHMGSIQKPNGSITKSTHNIGDRISWTLRPIISAKLNRVVFEDGKVQDVPGEVAPKVGDVIDAKEMVRKGDVLEKVVAKKKIKEVLAWSDRRENMQQVCKVCHSTHHIENFYKQFDSLVVTYNDKFAKPGLALYKELQKDGLTKNSGFGQGQYDLGYIWFEIWHHEGRRARHGAAMQAPDYTHWHGLYEVARHFYEKMLPAVMKIAKDGGKEDKYKKLIADIIDRPEHVWFKDGSNPHNADQMKQIEAENKARYGIK